MYIAPFEKEVRKVEWLLCHISRSMLSQQEGCADAVQEALTRAWQPRGMLYYFKSLTPLSRGVFALWLRREGST